MKKTLIILIGMSGSGKSTILHSLSKTHNFTIIPQWTTRPKRKNEETVSDYLFANKKNSPLIVDLITHYSTKTVYGVWHYGFSRKQFNDNPNKINILVTDLKSALTIQHELEGQYRTHIIFLNPSITEIQRRLAKRGDNPEEVARRLLADCIDFQFAHKYCDAEINYSGQHSTIAAIKHYLRQEGVL